MGESMAKLLIIEDEEILRTLLARALTSEGFEIIQAEDGEAGLNSIRANQPDIIITDMSLPKMTGWQLVEAVRKDPDVGTTPIIALSAHATAEDRTAAYNAGVSAYEEKPADIARLKEHISNLLRI